MKMISNYIIRNRIDRIKSDLRELGKKKLELQEYLRSLGLTNNQKGKQNIDPFVKVRRDSVIGEIGKIEEKTKPLRIELQELHRKEDAEKNLATMAIFKEIFSDEQMSEIFQEARNRIAGEENKAMTFSFRRHDEFKGDFYKYRQLAKQQTEKMIEFRIMLTGLIEKGCERFGDAEFLKFISPLNQLIIPLKELEKIKRQHFL